MNGKAAVCWASRSESLNPRWGAGQHRCWWYSCGRFCKIRTSDPCLSQFSSLEMLLEVQGIRQSSWNKSRVWHSLYLTGDGAGCSVRGGGWRWRCEGVHWTLAHTVSYTETTSTPTTLPSTRNIYLSIEDRTSSEMFLCSLEPISMWEMLQRRARYLACTPGRVDHEVASLTDTMSLINCTKTQDILKHSDR